MKNNNAFVLREIYGQFLLIPVRKNQVGDEIISLNEIGADIWKITNEEKTPENIISDIAMEYGLKIDSVEIESVRNFISILYEKKLLID